MEKIQIISHNIFGSTKFQGSNKSKQNKFPRTVCTNLREKLKLLIKYT